MYPTKTTSTKSILRFTVVIPMIWCKKNSYIQSITYKIFDNVRTEFGAASWALTRSIQL